MENSAAGRRFAPTALMLGNIVTGCAVLAPAAMLKELSEGLDVSVRSAGTSLITFGAAVLCVASPMTAWLTSRFERRSLLAATLAVLALANLASAFVPDYASLLALRIVMLAIGALYTPQAAGTAAMIVPESKRGSTIAYVFLGWSLAAAVGLPLVTLIAARYGWRAAYGGIGALGVVSFLLLIWRLPSGLPGTPVALRTWLDLLQNRLVLLLLLITTLFIAGQFVIFTYMGPLLSRLTGAQRGRHQPRLCALRRVRLSRDRVCNPHRRQLGRLSRLVAVHGGGAGRDHGVCGHDRQLSLDGRFRRGLGSRFRSGQLDATGAPGGCGTAAGVRIRIPQYFGALHRPGDRLGRRRTAVWVRSAVRDGLCGCGLCGRGAADRDRNPAKAGPIGLAAIVTRSSPHAFLGGGVVGEFPADWVQGGQDFANKPQSGAYRPDIAVRQTDNESELR